MATAAQITANQANAQLSTGPRTPEGKAASAANSRKEGLTAQTLVIPDDQRAAFETFRLALIRDTRPQGAFEDEFFQRLLTYGWNLRRARLLESTLLAETDPIHDEQSAARLQRFTRYRRDLERSYDRALAQLRHLQTQRAVLLQQDARVVDAVSGSTPVADLTRITRLTDPYFFDNDPFRKRDNRFFPSRDEALAHLQAERAALRNEPNLSAPQVIENMYRSSPIPHALKDAALQDLIRAARPSLPNESAPAE